MKPVTQVACKSYDRCYWRCCVTCLSRNRSHLFFSQGNSAAVVHGPFLVKQFIAVPLKKPEMQYQTDQGQKWRCSCRNCNTPLKQTSTWDQTRTFTSLAAVPPQRDFSIAGITWADLISQCIIAEPSLVCRETTPQCTVLDWRCQEVFTPLEKNTTHSWV